jgi:hypothetical protein
MRNEGLHGWLWIVACVGFSGCLWPYVWSLRNQIGD